MPYDFQVAVDCADPHGLAAWRIIFQLVPEPKTVKNRVHLDVWVGQENVTAAKERLTARDATFLDDAHQGPHEWVTLADPEGNEFCLS